MFVILIAWISNVFIKSIPFTEHSILIWTRTKSLAHFNCVIKYTWCVQCSRNSIWPNEKFVNNQIDNFCPLIRCLFESKCSRVCAHEMCISNHFCVCQFVNVNNYCQPYMSIFYDTQTNRMLLEICSLLVWLFASTEYKQIRNSVLYDWITDEGKIKHWSKHTVIFKVLGFPGSWKRLIESECNDEHFSNGRSVMPFWNIESIASLNRRNFCSWCAKW